MAETENLPWYQNPTKIFLILGAGAAAFFIWIALGSPGKPLDSGSYSCLNPDSFATKQDLNKIGAPYTFDPRETQWGARIEGGELVGVTVYEGKQAIGDPDKQHEASSFSLTEKLNDSTFEISADGSSAICYQSS